MQARPVKAAAPCRTATTAALALPERREVASVVVTAASVASNGRSGSPSGGTSAANRGFRLPQAKTGVKPWCPIVPELELEMARWERRAGPYLLQKHGKSEGKPFSTNQLRKRSAASARNTRYLRARCRTGCGPML